MRLTITALVCVFGTILAPRPAAALDFPTRPVHVIVPFTAGGAPDVLMRLLGTEARGEMGPRRRDREPRRRQHADRHGRRRQERAGRLHADPRRRPDLRAQSAALQLAALFDEGVRPDRPDGVDSAHARGRQQGAGDERQGADRARQGQARHLTYGTTGPGTIQRIATEYFAGIAGIKLVHVPYKGANETTTAILAGEIDMTINGMSNILPHIGEGKLKALAVSTVTRNPLAPDVPTMQEAGVPGYSSQGAFGLFAPAGTPRDIIATRSTPTPPRCWRSPT